MARTDAALAAWAILPRPSHRGLLLVAVVWCAASAMLTTSGCAAGRGSAVQTVDAVDVDRYVGTWFEIARFPNGFQDECIGGVTATYALRSDGRLDVINRCQTSNGPTEARGIARIVDTETRARLQVRFAPAVLSFLPFVWGDYWILGLAHDYSWAVVGSPDREYLWILARTSALDWERYTLALAIATGNGFAVDRLIQTSQSSDVAARRILSVIGCGGGGTLAASWIRPENGTSSLESPGLRPAAARI